ncbi:hypothetical protein D3C72_1444460 [compost metagenome]
MVQVRMRQHKRFDVARRNGKRRPVAQAQGFDALEQAAIQQHLPPLHLKQVPRTGDGAGSAQKTQSWLGWHGFS